MSSLAAPLTSLARPGDVIVDFCSGGGHLGLLVSHLAPGARVHMVENKEESLARARARGIDMGLTNVWFYQCNLEFYVGRFNIGLLNSNGSQYFCSKKCSRNIHLCPKLEALVPCF